VRASRIHGRALRAHAEGRFEEARALCARSLRILERESGLLDCEVANVLNTYGVIQQDLGRYPEAEEIFRRSVGIVQDLSGELGLDRLRVRSFRNLRRRRTKIHARVSEGERWVARKRDARRVSVGSQSLQVHRVASQPGGVRRGRRAER
jgi:tetratricopeptide (TPR) repeat protein